MMGNRLLSISRSKLEAGEAGRYKPGHLCVMLLKYTGWWQIIIRSRNFWLLDLTPNGVFGEKPLALIANGDLTVYYIRDLI